MDRSDGKEVFLSQKEEASLCYHKFCMIRRDVSTSLAITLYGVDQTYSGHGLQLFRMEFRSDRRNRRTRIINTSVTSVMIFTYL